MLSVLHAFSFSKCFGTRFKFLKSVLSFFLNLLKTFAGFVPCVGV